MKKFKRSIAWCLIIIFMMPMVWSCSRSDGIEIYAGQLKYREMAKSIIVSQELFHNVYRSSDDAGTFDYGEISQEDVDYYAELLGYEAGEFDVELVDAVVEKYIDVLDRGYEVVIEDFGLSSFTKLSMVDIAEGRWIEDLESHPDYADLNLTEKELLSLANAYAQELEQRNDLVTTEAVGAFFGMIIGAWFCNVLCVLGGAIVGGLIGGIVGKSQ